MTSDSPEATVYLSRLNPEELLGTCTQHTILLDDQAWSTVEHYIIAMRLSRDTDRDWVRSTSTPAEARSRGRVTLLGRLLGRQRENWKDVRAAYMTRAMYTKCKAFPEVALRLLETGERRIVESDQYDYYWGSGRDFRGENAYGQVLMNIRQKLREESAET